MSSNEYDIEKSAHYTKELIQLAHERWGDVPLSPQTYTWGDGTVSVIVEHNICDEYHPSMCTTCRLDFQETGFRGVERPMIRETVEQGVGSDGRVVWEEELLVKCNIDLYDNA